MSRVPFTAFFVVAGLMLVQAVTGLAFPSLYRDTEAWILAAWRGNDALGVATAVFLGHVAGGRRAPTSIWS